MEEIKVGFCVAYDWQLLAYALPMIYSHSDTICLAIDQNRTSWSGHRFAFDESSFRAFVKSIDVEDKIRIYEDDFFNAALSPMENECRQRNGIARFLGTGGWHVQLDCDEYFLDFPLFVDYLRSLRHSRTSRANVCCAWITLYKQVDGGFLYVHQERKDTLEFIQVASREPYYEYGRRNGYFNIHTNFKLLHQSWARPADEILAKINNWGHSADFDAKKYFDFWNSLTSNNFAESKDLHYLVPKVWPALRLARGNDVLDLIRNGGILSAPKLTRFDMYMKNSKGFSRIRALKKAILERLKGAAKGA
jgi:hypothetical protein